MICSQCSGQLAEVENRVAVIPFFGERGELVCGVLGVDGGVDLAQVGGERFAVLVGHEADPGADLMHQAGLDGRVREGRLDRLREAGEPVDADEHGSRHQLREIQRLVFVAIRCARPSDAIADRPCNPVLPF